MRKQTPIFSLAVVVICLLTATVFAEVSTTTGSISKVTVYRGQALVTRTINIDLPAGTSELIVRDLPAKIVPESLYAQTSGDIKVLSVRYREKAVKEDTREEVKKLDAQIEEVNVQIYNSGREHQMSMAIWDKFKTIWNLSADGSNINLNRGILEFKPIKELTEYLETKSVRWHKEVVRLEVLKKDLKKELELLKRKRAELDAGRSRSERQAILFVRKSNKKKSSIELSYLVNGANWLPQYNLRANPDKSNALIEYNAVVNQTSGENWEAIKLSLSTAEPAMIAAAPVLEPMNIVLIGRGSGNIIQSMDMKQSASQQAESRPGFRDRSEYFNTLIKDRRIQSKKGKAAQSQLRQIAASNQAFEFSVSKKELLQIQKEAEEITRTEGVSVTYDLPGKLTLPSRTDQQLVTISSVTLKAEFTLVASPLMTDYVYLQANLLNDSESIFLPGPAAMFRNGEFVGRSDLPIVTIGEKFTAGFGIDSQIQVVRELEDKKTKIQGGNRIDTYNYRIALSNYKNSPAELRLLDRLPYTDNESIKIELLETNPELSKDSEYLRTCRKKGILRWDLNLAPNSVDRDAAIVNYSFTMEYDKNMQIQPRKTNN